MAIALIVDSSTEAQARIAAAASELGLEAAPAGSAAQALEWLRGNRCEIAVVALRLEEERSGLAVLQALLAQDPETPVVMITAYGAPEVGVETMRLGAFDYLEGDAPGLDSDTLLREKLSAALEHRLAERGSGAHE
jgi:DNA-binding NtrC family response regulator